MSFHINISGAVGHLSSEIHEEIIKLANALSEELTKLGIEHNGSVGTPTAGQSLGKTAPVVVSTGTTYGTATTVALVPEMTIAGVATNVVFVPGTLPAKKS